MPGSFRRGEFSRPSSDRAVPCTPRPPETDSGGLLSLQWGGAHRILPPPRYGPPPRRRRRRGTMARCPPAPSCNNTSLAGAISRFLSFSDAFVPHPLLRPFVDPPTPTNPPTLFPFRIETGHRRCSSFIVREKQKKTKRNGKLYVLHRRNSLRARPPPMGRDDPYYPGNDRRYEDLSVEQIPLTESLMDCMERGACFLRVCVCVGGGGGVV